MSPNPNSLLNDDNRIAKNMNKDQYRIVRPRLHDPEYFFDLKVLPYLNAASFRAAVYIQIADLQANLILALVEI